jgi:Flp pilus assembly protein TadG
MTHRDHFNQLARRRGAAMVEFAIVAPLLFLLVLGIIEFTRMEMLTQTIIAAAQEGARSGVVPGSNSADVAAAANETLASGYVAAANVTVTPAEVAALKQGEPLTVTIAVPFDSNSWLPSPMFLRGKVLRSQCTMLREAR